MVLTDNEKFITINLNQISFEKMETKGISYMLATDGSEQSKNCLDV